MEKWDEFSREEGRRDDDRSGSYNPKGKKTKAKPKAKPKRSPVKKTVSSATNESAGGVVSTAPQHAETFGVCELTKVQKEVYKDVLCHNPEEVAKAIGEPKVRLSVNVLADLTKICNHPFLLKAIPFDPYTGSLESLVSGSGKLLRLHALLTRAQADKKRVLVLCSSTQMMEILLDYAQVSSLHFAVLWSGTPKAERSAIVDIFNEGTPEEDPSILFASYRILGDLGKALSVDVPILYDLAKSPEEESAALALLHPVSNTSPLSIHRLLLKHSVEQSLLERFLQKQLRRLPDLDRLDDNVIPVTTPPGAVDTSELEKLLKFGAYDLFEKSSFASAQPIGGPDVNDPDFWAKLLPPPQAETDNGRGEGKPNLRPRKPEEPPRIPSSQTVTNPQLTPLGFSFVAPTSSNGENQAQVSSGGGFAFGDWTSKADPQSQVLQNSAVSKTKPTASGWSWNSQTTSNSAAQNQFNFEFNGFKASSFAFDSNQ